MHEVLTKPIVPETLAAALARFASGATPPPASAPASAPAPVLPVAVPVSRFDASVVAGLERQLGAETTREICRLFVTQLAERRDRMLELRALSDLREMEHLAHAVKGMAANLGLIALQALSHAIERACREGDDAAATALVDRLDGVAAEALYGLECQLPGVLDPTPPIRSRGAVSPES